MRNETFQGRPVHVTYLCDSNDEHVAEFVDPALYPDGAVLAVLSMTGDWSDARLSINPEVDSVPVDFVEWAIRIARTV